MRTSSKLGRYLAIVAAVVAALGTGAAAIPFASTYSVTVTFADTAGLFVGNDVGVLGVKVGEVERITPAGAGVEVELELDQDVTVPADAQALIVSRSVANDRYVELTPRYSGGPVLADGDLIASERTRTPADFDAILNALDRFSSGLAGGDGKSVDQFLQAGAETLGPNGQRAGAALADLAAALNAINGHTDSAVTALHETDELTSAMVAHDALVELFIENVAATSDLLAEQRTEFTATLRTTREAIEALARFTQANDKDLQAALAQVNAVLDLILAHTDDIEEFVEVLPLALQNVEQARAPGGVMLRVPLTDALSEELAGRCREALSDVCEIVGTDPLPGAFGAGGRP